MAWNKRLWSVLTIYIETFLFCHALGAWPAIEFMLRYMGYYESVCPEDNLDCNERNQIFSRMYSLTYISLNLNKVIGALIFDYYGMWWARSVSAVFLMAGCVAWIFASPAQPWLVWIGLFLFVGWGTSLSFLNLNNTNFYPDYQGITISFIAGVTATSQFLYTIAKNLMENTEWFEIRYFWIIILCCTPIIWWRTFFLNPKYMIPKDVPEDFKIGLESRFQLDYSNQKIETRVRTNTIKSLYGRGKENDTYRGDNDSLNVDDTFEKATKPEIKAHNRMIQRRMSQLPTMRDTEDFEKTSLDIQDSEDSSTSIFWEIFSLDNSLIYIWFLFMDIRITAFTSQFQVWIMWVSEVYPEEDRDNLVSFYTDMTNIINLCGIILGPLLGFLCVDLIKRILNKKYGNTQFSAMCACTFGMFLITCAAILLSGLACIRNPVEIHPLTILCDFFIRALLYVVRNVLLIILNRDKVFGRVMGVANGVAVVTGFLMSPFLRLIQDSFDGNFVPFELIFLGVGCVVLLVPGHFIRRCYNKFNVEIKSS